MKDWKTTLVAQIIYMAGTGLGLLVAPHMFTNLLHLGAVEEVWVRVVGLLALMLCFYYYQAIKHDAHWFAQTSSIGRYFFTVGLAVTAWQFGITMLIALAALEFLLALWTQWALMKKHSTAVLQH